MCLPHASTPLFPGLCHSESQLIMSHCIYGLEMKCLSKSHILKAQSPAGDAIEKGMDHEGSNFISELTHQ